MLKIEAGEGKTYAWMDVEQKSASANFDFSEFLDAFLIFIFNAENKAKFPESKGCFGFLPQGRDHFFQTFFHDAESKIKLKRPSGLYLTFFPKSQNEK